MHPAAFARATLAMGSGALLVMLASALTASPARAAAPEAMAILGIEADQVPEALAARITAALRDALAYRAGVQAMPGKDLVEMRFLFGCTEEAGLGVCLAQAGKSLVVNRLIFGSLKLARPAPGARKVATYFIRLRVLDVNNGTVEPVEVHETVVADQLAPLPLAASAGRWLTTLLGPEPPKAVAAVTPAPAGPVVAPTSRPSQPAAPPVAGSKPVTPIAGTPPVAPVAGMPPIAAVTPPPPSSDDEIPWDDKPGRRLLAGGIVATVLAAAAFGVSVATWRVYAGKQGEMHDALLAAGVADPVYAARHLDYFRDPTCAVPSDTAPNTVDNARAICESGQSYVNATRGLLITGSVLGAVGITGTTLGMRRMRGEPSKKSQALGPSLAPGAGGFVLTF